MDDRAAQQGGRERARQDESDGPAAIGRRSGAGRGPARAASGPADPRGAPSRRALLGTAAALACLAPLAAAQDAPAPARPPADPPPPEPARPRTAILVRHGEKSADDPKDPGLSEAGTARAAALVRLLGDTKVTHVFTTEWKRTKDFGAGVAAKHALEPVAIPGRDLEALAARLRALPEGAVALVVGHSNTLPAVAKALGASLSNLAGGKDLRDDEYDRCVVVTLGAAAAPPALLELRYGS